MRNLALILLMLMVAACEEPKLPSPFHARDISWQYAQPDFQLTDFNGASRTLVEFKGKVVVLFFGYMHCPDVCPATLVNLSQVMRLLGADASRVQVVFITLDPERDKPKMLAKFVPSFNSSFLGLYGDAQATAHAAKSFGVDYEKKYDKRGGYTLDHTDGIYLLGVGGKPLLRSPHGQSVDQLVRDIRLLLAVGR